MEEDKDIGEKEDYTVPPLHSMCNHFLGLVGSILNGQTLDLNVPEQKAFSDAFDEWNSGVVNPDRHISLESQKQILNQWAQEEFECVQSPETRATFYSNWFSNYQGLPYGELIVKSSMTLPQARLRQYLQLDPKWKHLDDFIHGPTPPHGVSRELSNNHQMLYKHQWNIYEAIEQHTDQLAELIWWAQRLTSKEVWSEALDNWLSQTPKDVYPFLYLLEQFGISQDTLQQGDPT
jgi:hypothetical protein